MTSHESAARERKIRKLVDEIDRQARLNNFDTHSRQLAEHVAGLDAHTWAAFATSLQVNPPSETTRLAIVAIYVARADALSERAREAFQHPGTMADWEAEKERHARKSGGER